MDFYVVPKMYKYFWGILVLTIVINMYIYSQSILFTTSCNARLQHSTQMQHSDTLLDPMNMTFLNFNVDKIHTVFDQIDNVMKDNKRYILSFLSNPIINNHSFEYFHNHENTCTDSPTEILIVVPSAPGNFANRNRMRNGDYRKFTNITENKTKLVFFIGTTKVNTTQSLIDQEWNTYHDIVQESYEDIYHNIRYKAVSMLKWASLFCPDAKYVLRNDDDIVVNLGSIISVVKRTGISYSNFILGRLRLHDKPIRGETHKVFLSKQEYPDDFLPPFALGGLLGYPMLTVELLYQAALRVKPIWLDDVYITGMCASKVGVKLLSDPQFTFRHRPKK